MRIFKVLCQWIHECFSGSSRSRRATRRPHNHLLEWFVQRPYFVQVEYAHGGRDNRISNVYIPAYDMVLNDQGPLGGSSHVRLYKCDAGIKKVDTHIHTQRTISLDSIS